MSSTQVQNETLSRGPAPPFAQGRWISPALFVNRRVIQRNRAHVTPINSPHRTTSIAEKYVKLQCESIRARALFSRKMACPTLCSASELEGRAQCITHHAQAALRPPSEARGFQIAFKESLLTCTHFGCASIQRENNGTMMECPDPKNPGRF